MISLRLENDVQEPSKGTKGSNGFDLTINSIKQVYKGSQKCDEERLKKVNKGFKEREFIMMRPFERMLFGTGIHVLDIPENINLQVLSRSGVSLKRGILVANAPGLIDSDYRGEIGIILINSTQYLARVEYNERIAQLIVASSPKEQIEFVTDYSKSTKTNRGPNGFGHTG